MTVERDQEKKIDHQNSPKQQEKKQEWKRKKETGKQKTLTEPEPTKTQDKSTKQEKSNILVDSTEGTSMQIPRQSRNRRENQNRDKSTSTIQSTMTIDPTKKADRNLPSKPEEKLLSHASAIYRIEGMMGHNSLSPPINTKDLTGQT